MDAHTFLLARWLTLHIFFNFIFFALFLRFAAFFSFVHGAASDE